MSVSDILRSIECIGRPPVQKEPFAVGEVAVEIVQPKHPLFAVRIPQIRQGLVETAQLNGLQNTILLENISDDEVLDCIDGIALPVQKLPDGQSVRTIYDGEEYVINRDIQYDRVRIEETLITYEISPNQTITVIVKKPDYIGKSKWDVYIRQTYRKADGEPAEHQIHTQAKILDEGWLKAFQNGSLPPGQVPLPTDALRVRANIIRSKNRFGKEVGIECEIVEIVEIIKHYTQDRLRLDF